MNEQNQQFIQGTSDINPFFELYALLKDAVDTRFTDEEIRKRLIELEPKLRPFFSPNPPIK